MASEEDGTNDENLFFSNHKESSQMHQMMTVLPDSIDNRQQPPSLRYLEDSLEKQRDKQSEIKERKAMVESRLQQLQGKLQ